jgi:hypothetical protein
MILTVNNTFGPKDVTPAAEFVEEWVRKTCADAAGSGSVQEAESTIHGSGSAQLPSHADLILIGGKTLRSWTQKKPLSRSSPAAHSSSGPI